MGIVRLSQSLFAGTAMSLAFAATANATETKVYTYDALGRLIGEVSQGTVNDDDARTYCYDSGGNRILVLAAQSGVTTDCSALDSAADLSIGNATVTEGGSLVFTVTRSGNTLIGASASYATADGTAVTPNDYTSKSDTVSFAAGEISQTITISTVDDTVAESSETMTVTLSGPSPNTTIIDGSGSGTINDNEPVPATIAIGDASVTEGGTLSFVVTRSGNTSVAASASYATADGTAVASDDYTATSGTVSFATGQTSQAITVATIDDTATESSEGMSVTLSNPSASATITDSSGSGTIADNDAPPTLIQITGSNLSVLPAHSSVYACSYSVNYMYGLYDLRCWLKSDNTYVYVYTNYNYGVDQIDPGYSLQGTYNLYVNSNYYNTGVAP